MNMSKIMRLSFALAALAAAPSARADVLFLQVNDAEYDEANSGVGGGANFDFATVRVDGGSDYLRLYDGESGLQTDYYQLYSSDGDSRSTGAAYFGDFDSGAGGYFTVELWDESSDGGPDVRVGWQRYYIAYMSDYIYADTVTAGNRTLSVHSVVPEPTSGLLLLAGGALLALRRRRG